MTARLPWHLLIADAADLAVIVLIGVVLGAVFLLAARHWSRP
jgi:hypothetical protein